jgi:hypothetical protein
LHHAIELAEDVAAACHVAGSAGVEVPTLLDLTGTRIAKVCLCSQFDVVDGCL